MNNLDKKASPFLDNLYIRLGGQIIQRAPDYKFDDWDKVVKFTHITYKIEEKARIGTYEDVLIEIMEDVKTGDLGWFYQTKADRLIYCLFYTEEDAEPYVVYAFKIEVLKNYLFEHAKELFRCSNISPKGYGLTLNVFLPLNIGIKIYEAPKDEFILTDKQMNEIDSQGELK